MKTIRTRQQLIKYGLIEDIEKPNAEKEIDAVLEKFSLAIPPEVALQLEKENLHPERGKPISLQYMPSTEELKVLPHELADPIGDDKKSPVKGIIHRYPDRCLLLPILTCPVYCRFCFRRDKVGRNTPALTKLELENAYQYIHSNPSIWEVILTGGDPLILKPQKLAEILKKLQDIPTVEVIRIHTRVPVVDTLRINEEMLKALKINKALYIILHANHSDEFTEQATEACSKIIASGIPMLGQSVLLKGINDNVEALSALMRSFVRNRIKPYYLHHPDLAQGTSHFRNSIRKGQELIGALRGHYSGLCQPMYMLDIPGGHGKVPLNATHVIEETSIDGQQYKIKDYQGTLHVYKD